MKAAETLEEFLKLSSEFKLGGLLTETPNPHTLGLAETSKLNPSEAFDSFKKVDLIMLQTLKEKLSEIETLRKDLHQVLKDNGRIFLCGCGATGRLSLTIETLWRQENPTNDSVFSFMAGGDVALIHSIEKFEDFPDFGERQLLEAGFKDGDILLASSEGGETPFVIGAALKASEVSSVSPYFLYCNPDDVLKKSCQRSLDIIENTKVKKFNLTHGPCALSGSTRLQSSSILEFAIGLALFSKDRDEIEKRLDYFFDWYSMVDIKKLVPFTKSECSLYQKNGYLNYIVDEELGITVLTDTTERSPTFDLDAFENKFEDRAASWSYLFFMGKTDSKQAWESLLGRVPRPLEWSETKDQTGKERLLGFDFSLPGMNFRKEILKGKELRTFRIFKQGHQLLFEFEGHQCFFDLKGLGRLEIHIALKLMLNTHSTILMGRLGRFESNIMTWVKPSNNKLIDRSIRYAEYLLKQKGKTISYEALAERCFFYMKNHEKGVPVVLSIVNEFSRDS